MSTPEPTITGDLERTPFLHALLSLHGKRATGTLAIWPEGEARGQDRIHFKDGVPVAARFIAADTPLFDRALLTLFARKQGPFAFYEGEDLVGDQAMRGKIEVMALIATSLRVGARAEAVASVLAPYEEGLLRVAPGADFKRYALMPREDRLVEVARAGASTVAELVEACELGPEIGRRLVYLFIVTRALVPYVQTGETARPSVAPGGRTATSARPPSLSGQMQAVKPTGSTRQMAASRPGAGAAGANAPSVPAGPRAPRSDTPPPGLSAESLALFDELQQRLQKLDTQTYFDMLGVPRDVGAEGVRKQFIQLAKRWHPDRLPPELAGSREDAQHLFHLLTAAHDTLADEQKRAAYLKTVQDGGGTPEADRKLAAVVAAAMEQQKAEVLMKRRDFVGAHKLLEHALSLHADDADLHVSYAWSMLNLDNGAPLVPVALRHLDRAIAMAPSHDRAHFYRGLALRRLDKENDAIAAFKRAADANPKNLDAAREVRLARMRGQLGAEAPKDEKPKDESLFSKLFGSSKKKS